MMDGVKKVFDAFTPEMPTEPPNITWQGMKDQVVKQYEDLKKNLNTAVNGPDIYAEDYTGDPKQERMDAVNQLVSQYGMLTGAGSTGTVGEGSLGTFIGARAAYKNNPKIFEQMQKGHKLLQEGVDRDTVYDLTSTFIDKDGKLRYELGDTYSKTDLWDKMNPGSKFTYSVYEGSHTVGELFNNDKLYELYPKLKNYNVNIKLDSKLNRQDVGGNFDFKNKTININAQHYTDALSILSHEVQHYIQNEESFAWGADPFVGYAKHKKELSDEMGFLVESLKDVSTPEAKDLLMDKYIELAKTRRELISKYGPLTNPQQDSPFYNYPFYKNTLGEAEARNTAARSEDLAGVQQDYYPWETLDVKEEDIFPIIYGDKVLKPNE